MATERRVTDEEGRVWVATQEDDDLVFTATDGDREELLITAGPLDKLSDAKLQELLEIAITSQGMW